MQSDLSHRVNITNNRQNKNTKRNRTIDGLNIFWISKELLWFGTHGASAISLNLNAELNFLIYQKTGILTP